MRAARAVCRARVTREERRVEPPYICPGCYTVGGRRCEPWCEERKEYEAELARDLDDDDGWDGPEGDDGRFDEEYFDDE